MRVRERNKHMFNRIFFSNRNFLSVLILDFYNKKKTHTTRNTINKGENKIGALLFFSCHNLKVFVCRYRYDGCDWRRKDTH